VSKSDWGDIAFAVFLLALVSVLVRPASLAPDFIRASGDGLTAIVGFAVSG
jgi:hypothetical protein